MRQRPSLARARLGGGPRARRAWTPALALALVTAGTTLPAPVAAQAPGGGGAAPAAPAPATTPAGARTVRLTLEESLRAALQRSPETRQAAAELEGIRGKQLQALGIGRPQIELTTALGPSPRARGDQVSSPDDQYSPEITGIFVRGAISIIQPIFTWGLIENARLAAAHGVRAARAGIDVKNTEVALRVKQAYWGAVTARTIREFLLEVRDQVQGAIARTERLVEGGYASDIDMFRFRSKQGELEQGLNLAERTLEIATQALGAWTGQPPGVAVEPADAALPADVRSPRAVELYIQDALSTRPEFAQLREGIQARRNLVEVERKQAYPQFFVGLVGDVAYATNRDRLENPYVVDPLYHVAVGPVLGFRYSLDFGLRAGKVKEAEAEVLKLEALQAYAVDNIPLQVRDAYTAVAEAARNVQALGEAHTNARRWLVASSSNVDLGIGDPDDLADAFVQYARTRAEYLQALYAYVYGVEQLAHAAGQDLNEVQRLAPPAP
jgi:outer membrane protein TolC